MASSKRRRKNSSIRENTEFESTAKGTSSGNSDGEFWFEDGNVVLIARNCEFRIFKEIIAHHSPVFHDMFSLPQPPSSQACPVVHLSDSPEDLRHVLRVCMPQSDPSVGPFTQKARPSIHAISAIIRLGHKYQMQHQVAQAVRYLKRWFTSDFAVWSAGKLHLPDAPLKRVHAIGVVNLARLVDEPSLLPTALLTCCLLDAQIVQGFAREDGARERLALDDVGRCFAARTRLAEEPLVLTLRIFSPEVSGGCADPQMCEMLLGQTLASVAHEQRDFARADVFASWVDRAADAGPLSCVNLMFQCCNSCQEMLKERDLEERLRVWKGLPEIMGVRVDGWAASSP